VQFQHTPQRESDILEINSLASSATQVFRHSPGLWHIVSGCFQFAVALFPFRMDE